jgi:hypothetical protein
MTLICVTRAAPSPPPTCTVEGSNDFCEKVQGSNESGKILRAGPTSFLFRVGEEVRVYVYAQVPAIICTVASYLDSR